MFEINYSQLIQYEILEKLVTLIHLPKTIFFVRSLWLLYIFKDFYVEILISNARICGWLLL